MARNTAVLDRLRSERDEARNAALAMMEAEDYDPNSEALRGLEERATSLDTQIERLVTVLNQQEAADALDGRMSRAAQRQDQAPTWEDRSWGGQFVNSDVWGNYTLRGTSSRLEVMERSLADLVAEQRALPHTLTSMADALPSTPVYDLTPPEPGNVLIPLCNVVQVTQNAIDYVVWVLKNGAAAVVPEGQVKPELEWEPSVTSASLDTIAGRTSFSRQLAEDAAAVRDFINGELRREVSKKVEAEAKAALAAATLPTASGPAGAGLVGALRAGQAAVQAAGYNPNGFLVSSNDLVELDIATMSQLGGAPSSTPTYWGMRPVVDPDAIDGTVIVGDFRAGVTHYRRNSVSLYVTDSHADNFARNILDALAEQRAKTIVTRPAALAEATAG